MCRWTTCLLIFGLVLQVFGNIVINELSGLESAQLGSNTTTIRCDYQYSDELGVEVKWFYNHNTQIFTWIPTKNEPTAMGPFKDLLIVDNDTIHFKETTRNLTGRYTCKVSSFNDEVEKTQVMIVYQPAKLVEFYPEDASETLICAAYELFPQPIITIAASYVSGSSEPIIILDKGEEVIDTADNFYNVTKNYKFDKQALHGTVEFVCNIFIPETDYNETRVVTYETPKGNDSTTDYPDYSEFTTETSINSTIINATIIYSTTTIKSTTQGDFAAPSCVPSKLMLVAVVVLLGSKR